MFKSIISKFQDFSKTVALKVVAFIGGIIGFKPQTVEVPAPPEIANDSNNTTEAQSEKKEEGFIKKSLGTVKKAASAAIKTVTKVLTVSAQIAYLAAYFAVPFQVISWAWDYAQAQGLIAIFMGLWNMGTIPYLIVCIAILIGIGAALITVETLWSALLSPVRRFLFRPTHVTNKIKQPAAKTENITSDVITVVATVVTQQVVTTIAQQMKGIEDRLTGIETSLKGKDSEAAIAPKVTTTAPAEIATPEVITAPAEIATPTPVEVVVDICPTTPTEEVKPEIVPVVIEEVVTEVVDIRPTPEPLKINNTKQLKNQLIKIEEKEIDSILMSYRASDLKKIIQSLNQSISDGLNKGSTREDKKTVLVSEIKKQLQYFKKFAVAA
jgi:hypothetical protein